MGSIDVVAVPTLIYKKGRHLFNQKLDIVFYDVTTFYFDSEVENPGHLRQKGFSKDGKIGKTQIVLGLLIDKYKQPVGYQIFEGNTFEGHTLKVALQDLKNKYKIENVIVVADRGMLCQSNIELVVTELGLCYIFGERLKAMPKGAQDIFLDLEKYDQQWSYDKNGVQVSLQYYTAYYEERKVICTYSEKRARKDRHDRQQRVDKAKQLLKNPSQLNRKARYHYLTKKEKNTFQLNEEKIKRDELFDGLLAISTNVETLSEIEVLNQYKHLFHIEHSFRTMKSILEVRPMFHWTDKRIRGHICMCFISLTMLTNIQLRLNKAGHYWSEKHILRTLDKMQISHIQQDDQSYYMRSKCTDEQQTLSKIFKLKKVSPLTHKSLTIR